jgi:thymidine phosphorylase
MLVVSLGGGRRQAQDPIDHRVGVADLVPLGEKLGRGQPIATVHAADEAAARQAQAELLRIYAIADEAPQASPVVIERIA